METLQNVLLHFDRSRRNVCATIIEDHLTYLSDSITEHCAVLGIDEAEITDGYSAPENPLSYEEQLEKLLENKANALMVLERLENGSE